MTELQTFVAQGWDDHAEDAAAVAARLPQGVPLVKTEPELLALANLAHHVFGEHLADWAGGERFLKSLRELPRYDNYGESGNALRRYLASLKLAAGGGDERAEFGRSDAVRIGALAASALAAHDCTRATALFEEALAQARSTKAPDSDPMNRALAITGNNLACTFEEKADRSERERDLMLLAAAAGREFWAKAGTWLETERAEYRLAMSWLAAGDAARSRTHAQACLDLIAAQSEPPALERFFGWEAMARAERAAGDDAAFAAARERVAAAFAELSDDDKSWCQPTLDALVARAA